MSYFFFILMLFFYLILAFFILPNPASAGDPIYGFFMGICGLGWIICSLVFTYIFTTKGGFDWVSSSANIRNVWVGLAWLFTIVALFFSAAFKGSWLAGEFPDYLLWLAMHQTSIILFVLIYFPCIFLLSSETPIYTIPMYTKAPFLLGLGITFIFDLGLIYGFISATNTN